MSVFRAVCAGFTIAIAIGLAFCYWEAGNLKKDNEKLSLEVANLTAIVVADRERAEKVDAAIVKLGESDAKRAEETAAHGRMLGQLARDSASIRAVLNTLVPRAVLAGLRSFQDPDGSSGAAGPKLSAHSAGGSGQ